MSTRDTLLDATRRGAGSNTRPPTPFNVTDATYCRSHRLFTPTNGPISIPPV